MAPLPRIGGEGDYGFTGSTVLRRGVEIEFGPRRVPARTVLEALTGA